MKRGPSGVRAYVCVCACVCRVYVCVCVVGWGGLGNSHCFQSL